jgi:hypothetical protein
MGRYGGDKGIGTTSKKPEKPSGMLFSQKDREDRKGRKGSAVLAFF